MRGVGGSTFAQYLKVGPLIAEGLVILWKGKKLLCPPWPVGHNLDIHIGTETNQFVNQRSSRER